MEKKNLPALIPAFSLTPEKSNIVCYSIKSGERDIFCEEVSNTNGWITMTNLRVQCSFFSEIKFIKQVGYQNREGSLFDRIWWSGEFPNKKNFQVNGYMTRASRVIPQKDINVINSYSEAEKGQLPLWALTTEDRARDMANKKVSEYNDKTLKSNALKFGLFIKCELEHYLFNKYYEIPKWRRKLFNIKKHEWIEERKRQSDIQEKVDEIIEEVSTTFEKKGIEYEDGLLYDPEKAQNLYNKYGYRNGVSATHVEEE